MATRVYLVTAINGDKRLVRASNKAQAVNHCAKSTFSASLPSQDELFELAGKGVKIENAVEESA